MLFSQFHPLNSAVNGALFTRPNKINLDLWESFGATGWNWNTISASIKTAEHFTPTTNLTSTLAFHGTSGPIFNSQRTPCWKVSVPIIIVDFITEEWREPKRNLVYS
ncbi:hypothetical protein B0H14DRAFT_3511750 [Mycena olivaceomarginata]|nr:hypothetical protein B0H14DRAFT_3511750 [Mycena olivaceomarginata]